MKLRMFFCSILLALSCFILVSCSEATLPKEIDDVVSVNVSEAKTYSGLADLIADVKTSVVDIYSYASNSVSAGSGVIVGESNNNYYIITNHHVIESATSFSAVIYNDEGESNTLDATLVGTSPKSDIAVLKVTSEDKLNVASVISDSDKVRVGDEVVAIGNPLGVLGGTVTHGIISAKEREVYISDIGYMDLFQTDAAINSGNSGGALFNYDGLLVGIVNSGYTSYEGLNFAIPANDAMEAFTSIVNTYNSSSNTLGYLEGETDLGITFDSGTIYSSSSLNSQTEVFYVYSVDSSSVLSGLVNSYSMFNYGRAENFYALTSMNGVTYSSSEALIKAISKLSAGDTVTFVFTEINYARGNSPFSTGVCYLGSQTHTVTVTLSQYIYSI